MSVFIHRLATCALILAGGVLAGCCNKSCAPAHGALATGATPGRSVASAPRNYTAEPGDVLKVTVYGEDDLSGEYIVGPDGEIALPLVGAVEVAGHALGEMPEVIAEAYRKGYLKDPKISVELKGRGG